MGKALIKQRELQVHHVVREDVGITCILRRWRQIFFEVAKEGMMPLSVMLQYHQILYLTRLKDDSRVAASLSVKDEMQDILPAPEQRNIFSHSHASYRVLRATLQARPIMQTAHNSHIFFCKGKRKYFWWLPNKGTSCLPCGYHLSGVSWADLGAADSKTSAGDEFGAKSCFWRLIIFI